MADAPDLGSGVSRRAGSSPVIRSKWREFESDIRFRFCVVWRILQGRGGLDFISYLYLLRPRARKKKPGRGGINRCFLLRFPDDTAHFHIPGYKTDIILQSGGIYFHSRKRQILKIGKFCDGDRFSGKIRNDLTFFV